MTSDEIIRMNYYERQFLGVSDFQAEQAYHIEMRRRNNIAPHTWGLVTGLELAELATNNGDSSVEVSVKPGIAIDGFGREIVVLSSAKIDLALLKKPLLSSNDYHEIWIGYSEERFRNPAPGYGSCDVADQRGRVRETYKLYAGPSPLGPTVIHDNITVAGATIAAADVPPDESIPFQQFPAAGEDDLWLIRLGSVFWNGTVFLTAGTRLNESRSYIGAIAEAILAPAAKLSVRSRWPKDANGVAVPVAMTVEGSLTVQKDLDAQANAHVAGALTVDGAATITGNVTAKADESVGGTLTVTKQVVVTGSSTQNSTVSIRSGTDAILDDKGSGYLVLGDPTKENVALDKNEIMARNGKDPSTLHLQASGGDLEIHKNVNDVKTRVIVKDTGNVGIGTEAPDTRLHITGGSDATVSAGSGFVVIGDIGGDNLVLDSNEIMARTNNAAATLYFQLDGGALEVHGNMSESTRVHVSAAGDVGLGTSTPAAKLDVHGRIMMFGQALSKSGTALTGTFVSVPWGTTNDWSIIVAPKRVGLEEGNFEYDNALLVSDCYAYPDLGNTGFRLIANFKHRIADNQNGTWNTTDGVASYLMIPK